MIEKEYYRLDELAGLNVTEGTLRYFIEQNKLTPAFFVPFKDYVLGGYINGKFNGFAIANYRGLVGITKNNNSKLLEKGKVTTNTITLLQIDNIVIKSYNYPFNIPCPNDYISGWLKTNPITKDWQLVPAKFYPQERDSGWSVCTDILKTFTKSEEEKKQLENNLFADQPKRVLSSIGFDFVLSDLCIRHCDLLTLGLIKPEYNKLPRKQKLQLSEQLEKINFKNEFEELLANILKSKPRIQAKKIHRILCDECATEEDSRQFDHHNILKADDQGIISWRDKYRGNAERSYTFDSLKNVISNVRKKIR